MAKAKKRRYKVLMSFEVSRETLPKRKRGILVKGEKFALGRDEWFTPEKLKRLIVKGFLVELKKKPRRKNRRKKKKPQA